jgi:molybdopterin/thiamine biosynthesis adenylyltransferase
MQAAEALKILIGTGEVLNGRLLLLDTLNMDVRTINLKKDPDCLVCAAR